MAPARTSARAAGACYLVTHVTSIAGLALYAPVLHDSDYVVGTGSDTRVLLGALCEVLLALSVVGTAVALFPVVRRHSRAGAAGYLGLRTLEAAVICVGIVSLLAVVTLRQDPPGGADSVSLRTVARGLVAVHDWTFLVGPNFVLGANTVLLAWLLYRSRLVPRVIAGLGVAGGVLIFGSATAVLLGAYGQVSTWGGLAAVPVFAWELALAGWLLVKGFRPSGGAGQ
ncbi:DUF4386 domain-containing protein [Yinghuangia seranimata]|uniref:DUF4386 domain-containing protein n=1 Tax=Yinghuangia seranimata TaxID=408067 RepID=UPI00248AAF86|nr:DUF4386 domain-containing protein [Yinghuangia seranimata]MDI2130656.1 DUF4386 domain-containing protein [Yinghuangia seranimata]